MAILIDPMEIYKRGLRDLSCLQGSDRLIFMLMDFDTMMEMEGWDHFFLYERHFAWYREMKEWLGVIDDTDSLAVLKDFESHLRECDVDLSPSEYEAFLDSRDVGCLQSCPDWIAKYCQLRPDRWAKASAYLKSQGLSLQE